MSESVSGYVSSHFWKDFHSQFCFRRQLSRHKCISFISYTIIIIQKSSVKFIFINIVTLCKAHKQRSCAIFFHIPAKVTKERGLLLILYSKSQPQAPTASAPSGLAMNRCRSRKSSYSGIPVVAHNHNAFSVVILAWNSYLCINHLKTEEPSNDNYSQPYLRCRV